MAVQRFLTLDIGANTIKLAEFVSTGSGNLSLVNFGWARMESELVSEENIEPNLGPTLQKLLVSRGVKSRKVAISVSGQLVLTRFLKLPTADEVKIRQMVRYEAAQNVPFPIEEVVWDYQVIGGRDGAELDVVMVAIKSDIIEAINRCLNSLGLKVELVDISSLSMYNALLYNYEQDAEGATLLLDIGARTTNMIFVESGKLFTRSIPIAGNTVTQNVAQEFEVPNEQAEQLKIQQGFVGLGGAYEEPELESAARLCKIIRNVMTRLHAEVARSINFYKTQQKGKAPKKLLLTGGTSITPYIDYFFKEKMELEIEYFNPFRNVPIQVQAEDLEKVVFMMGEVVGLGLRLTTECPVEINLIPPTVAKKQLLLRKIPYFIASLLGVLCIAMSWWLYFWRITALEKDHLEKVGREVASLERLSTDYKDVQKHADEVLLKSRQLQKIIESRYYWIRLVDDLGGLLPANLWITEMTPLSKGKPVGPTTTTSEFMPPARRITGSNQETPVEKEVEMITEIEISGCYILDSQAADPFQPFQEFKTNLSQSQFFKPINTEKIDNIGEPTEGDWTAVFKVKVELKEPLPF